mgnify:CR=1 FL=1
MDDFNAAFGKIDETLKANADAVAAKAEAETVTAIAQTIASSKICRAKFGTYTGTGLSGQNHPNSVEENDGHTRRDRLLVRHRLHEQLLYMG